MSLSVAFALIAAVLAVVAIFRSKGNDLAAWGVLALSAALILPGVR